MKTGRRQGETCVFSCFQGAAWEGRRPGVYLAGGPGGGGSADELQALFYQFGIVRKSRAILAAFLCFSPSASSPRVGFGRNLTFSLIFARDFRLYAGNLGGFRLFHSYSPKIFLSDDWIWANFHFSLIFARDRFASRSQGERLLRSWLLRQKKVGQKGAKVNAFVDAGSFCRRKAGGEGARESGFANVGSVYARKTGGEGAKVMDPDVFGSFCRTDDFQFQSRFRSQFRSRSPMHIHLP